MHLDRIMKFAIILMLLNSVGLFVTAAFACDCLTPPSTEERLKLAAVVFSGEVVSVEQLNAPTWTKSYRFKVIQSFKGPKQTEYTVHHSGTNCAFDFEKGTSYLVFAYHGNHLEVNICSGTQKLSEALKEVRALETIAD